MVYKPGGGGESRRILPESVFVASEPDQEDAVMNFCAECRNVDIKNQTVVCLGSEEWRRVHNCLDVNIKWENPTRPRRMKVSSQAGVIR